MGNVKVELKRLIAEQAAELRRQPKGRSRRRRPDDENEPEENEEVEEIEEDE
jgi:hypothetical protein